MELRRGPTDRSAAVEQAAERRHERSAERVLDQRRRDERRYSDQPRLFNAELDAKRQPGKPGRENDDVAKSPWR